MAYRWSSTIAQNRSDLSIWVSNILLANMLSGPQVSGNTRSYTAKLTSTSRKRWQLMRDHNMSSLLVILESHCGPAPGNLESYKYEPSQAILSTPVPITPLFQIRKLQWLPTAGPCLIANSKSECRCIRSLSWTNVSPRKYFYPVEDHQGIWVGTNQMIPHNNIPAQIVRTFHL